MREMVLNHASLRVDQRQRDEISDWLLGLAQGMAELVKNGVVPSALRMERSPYETFFLDDYSLWDAYVDLRRGGQRDEFLFFVRLALKLPLLQEVTARIEERFLGCEGLTPPHEEGKPLLLCAIADWISISFPSYPDWNHSRLAVRFLELGPDAHLEETREEIDNVAIPLHATEIIEQHQHRMIAGSDPTALWENRQTVFPNLGFGPGVEENLRRSAGLFSVIVGKLVLISQSADEWAITGGPAPAWKTKVTREGTNVRNNPTLLAARRFPSQDGGFRIFEWHARYGNNGRIHLFFDAATQAIEIGYIGPHLPL